MFAIAVIVAIGRFAARVPASLVALVTGIVISALFTLSDHDVDVVGDLPSGLAGPVVPDVSFGDLVSLAAGAIGLALVTFAVIYRAANARVSALGSEPGRPDLVDVAEHPDARSVPGVLAARPNAPVFFANAVVIRDWVVERLDGIQTVVLDLEATTDLDVPGADLLRELHETLGHRKVGFRLARVHHDVRVMLDRAGVLDLLGADHVHATVHEAIEAARPGR